MSGSAPRIGGIFIVAACLGVALLQGCSTVGRVTGPGQEGVATDKDARYHFLMKKASEKFLDATRQMAKELDFDLVAEVGAVRSTKRDVAAPPDRTDDIVSRLR